MWTEELELADRREVDERGDKIIYSKIGDNCVMHGEASGGRKGGYMTDSEVKNVMGDNMKMDCEAATRNVIVESGGRIRKVTFSTEHDEQNEKSRHQSQI